MQIIKNFIKRKIAGETILVPCGETTQDYNGIITVTDTAAFILDNIENVENFDELLKLILENYSIDEKTARRDAENFISQLMRSGICKFTEEDKLW